jgi:ribosomal protein S27AE
MYERCPKCGHGTLPHDQSLPAACPACGVILAKVGTAPARTRAGDPRDGVGTGATAGRLRDLLLHVPERVDATAWRVRVALLLVFAAWGLRLGWMDYRDGEIMDSFLHRPLLVFHEAGHVVFRPFGEWMTVLGGTLGQLLMPAILGGALLWKNRDPFGAALGLWLLGVSVLDVAPYMYDALEPQLMLLSGSTGEDGGHDWIYLFASVGRLARAQGIGAFTHAVGVAVVLVAIAWAAAVLRLQRRRIAGTVLFEE